MRKCYIYIYISRTVPVAVKVLDSDLGGQTAAARRFDAELAALRRATVMCVCVCVCVCLCVCVCNPKYSVYMYVYIYIS